MQDTTTPHTESVKVTVYIVSRNYGRFLEEAIQSVLQQSMDDWELLLINDNSSDATQEVMERYAHLRNVSLLQADGQGLVKAANMAIENARGGYIIRLDADDVFDENILLVLSNHLDNNPHTALVFPDYYLIDEYGHIFANERREQVHYKNHMQDLPPHGACTMMRVDALREVGGYSEDIKAQDGYYIWSKLREKHRCSNVNLPLFYYRRHGKNLTNNTERILQARQSIKRDSCAKALETCGPVTAIIPCRQNFDIQPDLWSLEIAGKSLLQIAIEKCLASGLFDYVAVTSDTELVQNVMDRFQDKRLVFVPRTGISTIPSRPLAETLEHVLRTLDILDSGISVLSYIQSPLTSTNTLEEAVYTVLANDADSAFTAEEIDMPLFSRTPHGLVQINSTGYLYSDFNVIYRELKNAFAVRNRCISQGSLTGSKIVHYMVSQDESFFLSSRLDIMFAETILKASLDAEDPADLARRAADRKDNALLRLVKSQ